MFKKSLIALLTVSILTCSTDSYVYAAAVSDYPAMEELLAEEELFEGNPGDEYGDEKYLGEEYSDDAYTDEELLAEEESEEPEYSEEFSEDDSEIVIEPWDAELSADGLILKSIAIKDIPAGKPQTDSLYKNTLKIWQGLVPEYTVTFSSATNSKIYPLADIDLASDDDVIIKLESLDASVISVTPSNNSIWGVGVGSVTIKATAYLKKNADNADLHVSATHNVNVVIPKGEIIDYYGRKSISFDGTTEYSGWVRRLNNGKYAASQTIVSGGSYFLDENDYIDCDESVDPSGKKAVSDSEVGSLAADCAVWISGRLYKFDSDGVVLKNDIWHRLKSIRITPDDASVQIDEGDKHTVRVEYEPELTAEDSVADINDDKAVHVSSSNTDKVRIGNVTYEYGYNYNNAKSIVGCTVEIIAVSAMRPENPDVVITLFTGDEDNKYADNLIKTINVRTLQAKGWHVKGNSTYYINADGTYAEGWKNIASDSYYFYTERDEELGYGTRYTLARGISKVYNSGENKTEFCNMDEDGCFIGKCSGWVTYGGKKYYVNQSGDILADCVSTIDGRVYAFDADGHNLVNGVYSISGKIYYLNYLGNPFVGYQYAISPEDATGVRRLYYFDSTDMGALRTGFATINGNKYYFREIATGSQYVGEKVTGYVKDLNSSGNNYYFDNSGIMKIGWQRISDGGLFDWHYFAKESGVEIIPDSATQEGQSYWRIITEENGTTLQYYFPNNLNPYIAKKDEQGRAIRMGMFVEGTGSKKYYVGPDGSVMKGWQKLTDSGVTDWHYFSPTDGEEKTVTVETDLDGKSKWRTVDGTTYFFQYDLLLVKGFRDILRPDGQRHRFYFDINSGAMAKGDFTYAGGKYYADDNGYVLLNSWDAANTSFYNAVGRRVVGFNNLSNKLYYFDTEGILQKGIIKVNNYVYLSDSVTGEILRNYYVEGSYYTNAQGIIQTGWKKLLINGENKYHYFSDVDYKEVVGYTESPAADGRSVWRVVNGMTFYFVNDIYMAKGFTNIKDYDGTYHTYCFDTVTGQLLTGKVKIGGLSYYIDDTGAKETSTFINVNGRYMYLNALGIAQKAWINVDGNRYYADPATGYIATGFKKIGLATYYFSEVGAEKGQMQKGFFSIPDLNQDYYDEDGSNMYYADANGAILRTSGWKNIKASGNASDAQTWSYYLSPDETGYDSEGAPVYGEIVIGDVVIDDNGNVTPYDPTGINGSNDIAHMYSFDEKTGARKKAVLYFHGGSYSESLMSSDQSGQYNTIMSVAKYMNTDRLMQNASDLMILAGYSDLGANGISMSSGCYSGTSYPDSVTRGTAGFPLAACKKVSSEADKYSSIYDIVSYNSASGSYQAGSDDAVDIGDIQTFSFDLYCKVIEKFGPNNVVLMGASSGGAIALSLLEQAGRSGVAMPSETILYSPWLDASMNNKTGKNYSSRGVNYDTLLYKGARVTRDAGYNNGNPYGNIAGAGGPGAASSAAWFASPALESNGCTFAGAHDVTIYAGPGDPCYPDVANFVMKHRQLASLYIYGSGHCYMFDNGGLTVQNTAKTIMTQKGVR